MRNGLKRLFDIKLRAFGEPEFPKNGAKPLPIGYIKARKRMGIPDKYLAAVGDQIFTDTLGGRRAGVTAILVRPIRLAGNPFRYVRYAVETPFRLAARRRGAL